MIVQKVIMTKFFFVPSLVRFILSVTDDSIREANSNKSEMNEEISNKSVIYYRSGNNLEDYFHIL